MYFGEATTCLVVVPIFFSNQGAVLQLTDTQGQINALLATKSTTRSLNSISKCRLGFCLINSIKFGAIKRKPKSRGMETLRLPCSVVARLVILIWHLPARLKSVDSVGNRSRRLQWQQFYGWFVAISAVFSSVPPVLKRAYLPLQREIFIVPPLA